MKKLLFVGSLLLTSIFVSVGVGYSTPLIGNYNSADGIQFSDYLTINGKEYLVKDNSGGNYTGATWSGLYLGTIIDIGFNSHNPTAINANESELDLENLITYYLGAAYNIVNYLHTERVGDTNVWKDTENGITLTVEKTSSSPDAGIWFIDPSNYGLDFYAVKGGNEFALYAVTPALNTGKWTTLHVLNPNGPAGFSHLSGSVVSAPVPEPATMLLFGAGLAGLAGIARRKKS